MAGLERWQDTISQNLAAASVPGYKPSHVSFEAALSKVERGDNSEAPRGVLGAPAPKMVSASDFSPGQLNPTNNPLDMAISGEGFFTVELPDGQRLFTRDGQFHVNAEGELVNKMGFPVLGESGPIQLTPNGGEITVNQRGEVLQGGAPVAKLAVNTFRDHAQLVRASGGFLDPMGRAGMDPVLEPTVRQGFIEESKVNLVEEMVRMISISRAYESSSKVVQTQDEAIGRAIQVFGQTR